MLRLIPFVAILLLPAVQISAETRRVGREQTLQVTANSGQPKRVFRYAAWGADCSPRPVPQVVVRIPPQHGTVATRLGTSTVSVVSEGNVDCTGHQVPATELLYTSQPGFRAADRFEYRRSARSRHLSS